MKLIKKILVASLSLVVGVTALGQLTEVKTVAGSLESVNEGGQAALLSTSKTGNYKKPKYIFTFIGDGMSYVQLNAASIYKGVTEGGNIELGDLAVSSFPVCGSATTQDSTSFCPDSASTATAISSGIKTHSGVIGYEADKETKSETIAEQLKKEGYKVGVVTSVSIDHATPAAFYAHVVSRSSMYDIALQMGDSGFNYFAGGALVQPTGKNNDQKDAYEILQEKGYKIADTKEEILALNGSDEKVYAISPVLQDSQAMSYNLDANRNDLKLKDFVKQGIEVLDNDEGFFMMVEGGKIDWAGHANDARSNIGDVLALNEAIQVAVDFAKKHPEETLILVTGDHETGGMTIGYSTTGYSTAFDLLSNQKMSYVAFNDLLAEYKETTSKDKAKLEDILGLIEENFGLVSPSNKAKAKNDALILTDYEYKKLEAAFKETMKESDERTENQETDLLYGGYEPVTVTLTHLLNNKAGIGWTSYSHTGVPVPVYAVGEGAELFSGAYDNTDIYKKLAALCEIK